MLVIFYMDSGLNAKISTEIQLIQRLRKSGKGSIGILIGGIFGVGKTTLAYNLSNVLGIKQRASLGIITKTLYFLNKNRETFRSIEQIERGAKDYPIFIRQVKTVCPIINYILKIAQQDGVDYILDGVQLHPNFLNLNKNYLYIFIKSPPLKTLHTRLIKSTTHTLRYQGSNIRRTKKILALENFLISSIKEKNNIKIINNTRGESLLLLDVLKTIRIWLQSLS